MHRALAHILSAGIHPAPALATQLQHAFEGVAWGADGPLRCAVDQEGDHERKGSLQHDVHHKVRVQVAVQGGHTLQLTSGGWERSATERHTENCLPDQVRTSAVKTGYWVPGCRCSGGTSLPAAGCTPLCMLLALHPSSCSPLWLNAHPTA